MRVTSAFTLSHTQFLSFVDMYKHHWNEATNNIPLFWAEAFIPYFPVSCLLETKTDLGLLQKVQTFSYLTHTKTPISTM